MDLFHNMTGPIARMSYVNRYSSIPVNRRENVAEHSWWVSFIALMVGTDLQAQGHDVKFDTLLMRAIMHDTSECMSGDIIRSYKHSDPEIREAMRNADDMAMAELTSKWGLLVGVALRHWYATAKAEDLEGSIVAFADMAAVAFYCREEDRSGNRAIRRVLREMYETWFHAFADHSELGQYIHQMFPNGRFTDMLREEELPATLMFQISGEARPMMRHHG